MTKVSLDLIQSKIAALVDEDPDSSNISTADYSLRTTYANMALQEWAEAYDWQVLYGEYNTLTSTSTGNASISLPDNFRKLASFPQISVDSSNPQFPETRPQDAGQYGPNDRRVEILGNPQGGYTMRVYGAALGSGVSVKVPYYQSVQSLASPANVAEIPNPDYLVKRVIAYWWEARGDDRFPQMKLEAERILGTMIDFENTFGEASTNDRVKTVEETRYGDRRWGE